MAMDWKAPKASNAILTDVDNIQELLNACIKLKPEGSNIPGGAIKLTSVTGGMQFQAANSSAAFSSVGKLMHDVDKLDGHDASTSALAGAIPVYDANAKLVGDITGNAAGITGTLPTAQGGTGRTDGAAQDVRVSVTNSESSAKTLGQIGNAIGLGTTDLDTLVETGFYVGGTSEHTVAPALSFHVYHVCSFACEQVFQCHFPAAHVWCAGSVMDALEQQWRFNVDCVGPVGRPIWSKRQYLSVTKRK